jgi:DNA-binding transcriptional MocR family regulator
MLDDPATIDAVATARDEYARRRRLAVGALASRGVDVTGTDGINLWMRVDDERAGLLTLAAQGIGAAPGEPFCVRDDDPHLRVTIGLVADHLDHLVDQLARAAHPQTAPSGQR